MRDNQNNLSLDDTYQDGLCPLSSLGSNASERLILSGLKAKEIPLTQGQVALVNAEDYDYLMIWKWHCYKDNSGHFRAVTGKRVLGIKGKNVRYKNHKMHRMIMAIELMDLDEEMVVDHYNHNTLDNRRCNLRVCTNQQNLWNNVESCCERKYKGVYKERKGFAAIMGKKRIGIFETQYRAALAYDVVCLAERGEYAELNILNF